MKEMWTTIPGYGGRYEVSNSGKVRSNYGIIKRELKHMRNAGEYNGYDVVTLYDENKVGRKVKVHRLVAEAFLPNPHSYPVINHKDENKRNNSVNNLEWCTVAYNTNYGTARKRAMETRRRTQKCRSRYCWTPTPNAAGSSTPKKNQLVR